MSFVTNFSITKKFCFYNFFKVVNFYENRRVESDLNIRVFSSLSDHTNYCKTFLFCYCTTQNCCKVLPPTSLSTLDSLVKLLVSSRSVGTVMPNQKTLIL
jgi:hypothetical protein